MTVSPQKYFAPILIILLGLLRHTIFELRLSQ